MHYWGGCLHFPDAGAGPAGCLDPCAQLMHHKMLHPSLGFARGTCLDDKQSMATFMQPSLWVSILSSKPKGGALHGFCCWGTRQLAMPLREY